MRILILLLPFLFATALKAEVVIENHTIVITGQISANEGETFLLKLVDALTTESFSHSSLQTVTLRNLSGGSVLEAIKISNAIENLNMSTDINGYCYSACALVYLSGTKRTYDTTSELGVHSISFANQSLGKLSLNEAKQAHKQNLELFLTEFSKHGAPTELITQIKNTASSEITKFPLSSIPIYKDFVREWASDRCGSITSENLLTGQRFAREMNDYIKQGGDDAYNNILQAAAKSGDPRQWYEQLGKKFHANFSYSEYQKTTQCYDTNLQDEFKLGYSTLCSKLNVNCDDEKTKFFQSIKIKKH